MNFSSYMNRSSCDLRLGFDVYQNIIAAATDDARVQVFDANDGTELQLRPSIRTPLPRQACCLRLADGNHTKGLRLFVPAGETVEEWAW